MAFCTQSHSTSTCRKKFKFKRFLCVVSSFLVFMLSSMSVCAETNGVQSFSRGRFTRNVLGCVLSEDVEGNNSLHCEAKKVWKSQTEVR